MRVQMMRWFKMSSKTGILKKVKRVEDKRGTDALIFRSNDGRICYLDKKEDMDLVRDIFKIGDVGMCYIVKACDTYDFVRVTTSGVSLAKFINNIPNITLGGMLDEHSSVFRSMMFLLNTVENNDKLHNHTTPELTLPNLVKIDEYYDKVGINSEIADWVCRSIYVLSYLYGYAKYIKPEFK